MNKDIPRFQKVMAGVPLILVLGSGIFGFIPAICGGTLGAVGYLLNLAIFQSPLNDIHKYTLWFTVCGSSVLFWMLALSYVLRH